MEKKNPNIYQRALDIVNHRINPDIPQGGGEYALKEDLDSLDERVEELEQHGGGQGWTDEQIDLLESIFDKLVYTDAQGGQFARALIASLRGEEPSEYEVSFADGVLTITKAPAAQSGAVLTIN